MALQFDPLLIVYQIICLQCFYYLSMGTLLGVGHAVFDINMSLGQFFRSSEINFISINGWIVTSATLLSAALGAYLLSVIVEKSKKCVDFTFTLFFIHIIFAAFYSQQFPLDWEWWLVQVLSSVLMASVGEYICVQSELEDIPLYTSNSER